MANGFHEPGDLICSMIFMLTYMLRYRFNTELSIYDLRKVLVQEWLFFMGKWISIQPIYIAKTQTTEPNIQIEAKN